MWQWRQWVVAAVAMVALMGCAPAEPKSDVSIGLDPQCDELLEQMCDTLRIADGFDVLIDATYTDGYGESLQRTDALISLSFRRPDLIYVTAEGVEPIGTLVWQSGLMTVVDAQQNIYAQADVPDTIDGFIEFALDEGLPLPLGALLSSDPYSEIVVGVQQSYYLGEEMVNDRLCHHMAFIGDEIDWEIWVDVASQRLPAKWVVTYKYRPNMPRRVETFESFFITKQSRNLMQVPPQGARQVTLEELLGVEDEESQTIEEQEFIADESIEDSAPAPGEMPVEVIEAEVIEPVNEPQEQAPTEQALPAEDDLNPPCAQAADSVSAPAETPARPIFEDVTAVEDNGSEESAVEVIELPPVEFVVNEDHPAAEPVEPAEEAPAQEPAADDFIDDTTGPADDLPADDDFSDDEIEPAVPTPSV